MLEKNIVKYKVSRQLKLALEQLNHRIIKKDYKVIDMYPESWTHVMN